MGVAANLPELSEWTLINSKDEKFFRYHSYYRTGYLTKSYCHKELGYFI